MFSILVFSLLVSAKDQTPSGSAAAHSACLAVIKKINGINGTTTTVIAKDGNDYFAWDGTKIYKLKTGAVNDTSMGTDIRNIPADKKQELWNSTEYDALSNEQKDKQGIDKQKKRAIMAVLNQTFPSVYNGIDKNKPTANQHDFMQACQYVHDKIDANGTKFTGAEWVAKKMESSTATPMTAPTGAIVDPKSP